MIFLLGAIFFHATVYAHVEQPKDLSGIGIDQRLGQTIPLDLTFNDENGRAVNLKQLIHTPTILAPVYYSCPNVCSFLLSNLAGTLNRLPAEPGKEYHVIALSFDENEKPDLALEKKKMYLKMIEKPFPEDTWRFLTGDKENILAHLGTAESCRILEKYLKISEENLRGWALLSLKECRTFLESVLLQEEGGFISTGLGGKENKLRYYFIVGSKDGLPFSETHRNTLKRGFETISHKYKSEIEEINFEAAYAMIGILIPMDVAVGEVIEEGISECNNTSEFLFPDYYVTNVKKPTLKEISKYLEEISHGEK